MMKFVLKMMKSRCRSGDGGDAGWDFLIQNDGFCIKMMDFVSKMMGFVSKMMDFVFK